jgi:formiminotetrahydrofolate cyclodeaminase
VETLDGYLAALASSAATPGGGSAAAIVAASGAALLSMVGRIYAENPKYAQYGEMTAGVVAGGDTLRAELLAARDRDEKAFARVVHAQSLPQRDDAEKAGRAAAIQNALAAAAEEPLHAAGLSLDVLRFASQLLAVPNKNLTSDIGCAAEFGHAGVAACAYNVRINHRFMRNADTIAHQAARLARYESEADALLGVIRKALL